jgi:large subunit ribosomal protein L6
MASRVAKNPIPIPSGIEVSINGQELTVKSSKVTVKQQLHPAVKVANVEGKLQFQAVGSYENANALAGTTRALVNNVVKGLKEGFTVKLVLVGVGFRAQMQGRKLVLTLGHSHPIHYELPPEMIAEIPAQTDIILKSFDKQLLGKVAAEIRAFRPPEVYKGKGVRYADEVIVLKEVKKK